MNRSIGRRTGSSLAALALTASLVGCGGGSVDLDDQREVMLDVVARMMEVLELVDIQDVVIVDDGTEPAQCPQGERFEYIAFGTSDFSSGSDVEVDTRLDRLTGIVASIRGSLGQVRDEAFVVTSREGQADSTHARRSTYHFKDGPHAGVELAVDFLPQPDSTTLLRISATTACG